MSDFNQQVIAEFRANQGKVGGPFAGGDIILLTTIGAKSGLSRTIPLVCLPVGDNIAIIASKGGAPSNPDWYYNLLANPIVTVERGVETYQARASVVGEPQRTQIYEQVAAKMPNFAEYQRNTTRKIPIVLLERINA